MKGLFMPEITAEMFRNGCLESIEALMTEGEIYDIEYSPWIPVSERLPEKTGIYLISIGDLVASKLFDGHNFRTESKVRFIPDAWMPLPQPYKAESEDKE